MIRRILTVTLLCNMLFISTAISQTKRYVKTIAAGTGDGSSWANASANLQAMIDVSANNDEVWVAKGTYKPTTVVGYNAAHVAYTDDRHKSFYVRTGVKLYGGFIGTEVTPGQRKLAQNKTYLSGDLLGNDPAGLSFTFTNNAENAYHVIVAISAHTVRIDGFMISGGNTTGMPATYLNDAPAYTQIPADGAGAYFYDCDYNITSSIFFNNYSTGKGGAVSNYSSGETGDIINSVFVNNYGAQGSVLYCSNSGANNGASNITNCTISRNSSGAATIFTQNNTNSVIIYNSVIMPNFGIGKTIDTNLIHFYYTTIQLDSKTSPAMDPGPDPLDPFFSNYFDADGVDNILGTSDDGLVPGAGSAAINAGFNNLPNLPAKDIRDSVRIQNGTIDQGAYETGCGLSTNSISITQSFDPDPNNNNDNNPYNDLPAPGLCEGGTAHFTATLTGSGGTFQWKKNGVNVGANSNTYNPTDFHLNDQVWVTYTSASACGSGTNTVQSNVITLQNVSVGTPVLTTSITGPGNACPYFNATAQVAYKINKVPGAVVYNWQFPVPGANIVSHPGGIGVNDTIVMVTYTSGFITGYIQVAARNWCGYSNTKKLSVNLRIAQATGAITGPTDVCPYIQSPANPSGTLATYTINKVVDASSYIWNVPAGTTASHPNGAGFNDTVITVLYSSGFASGAIMAQGINLCGSKPPRFLNVLIRNVATPGTITGPTSVCAFKQSPSNPPGTPVYYTIRKVLYATSYMWTIPANATVTHPGGTGINDTIIRVTYNSAFTGGAITVKANNNCNTSTAKSLTISYILPSTPGVITAGAPTVCPTRRITYSLAALPSHATSVQWTVPASGTIISGQGTLSLVVQFSGPTSITDTIRVVGVNDCGTSSQRKLKVVALTGTCRSAGKSKGENIPVTMTKVKAVLESNTTELDVTVMPNPSQQRFTLQLTGVDINIPATVQVTDAAGRTIEIKHNIQSTIIIGNEYKPGIYFAIITQGERRKVVRLVKL